VWIADDVGSAAPANTKIDESTLEADQDDYYGAFSLSKPTAGWPVGSYHVDIYLNDKLATTAHFTIEAPDK
jgi:outer membrane usher protein FimD/PapC